MAQLNGARIPMTMEQAMTEARAMIEDVGAAAIQQHTITEYHWDRGPSMAEQMAGVPTIGRGTAACPIRLSRDVVVKIDVGALGMAIWDGEIDVTCRDAAEIAAAIYNYQA